MGRDPKPTATIQSQNVTRQRARFYEPQGDDAAEIPKPKFNNVYASEYWDQMLPKLEAMNVLQEQDIPAFQTLCQLYGRIQHRESMGKEPSAALLGGFLKLQGLFGLTPADRTRIQAKPKGDRGLVYDVIKRA